MKRFGEPAEYRTFTEIATASSVAAFEIWQKYGFQSWAVQHVNFFANNVMLNFLAFNTGDFGNGYAITVGTDLLLSAIAKNKLPREVRRWGSLIPSVGAVLIAETMKLPIDLFGTPDLKDIPIGILGALAYVGFSRWANRPKSRRN